MYGYKNQPDAKPNRVPMDTKANNIPNLIRYVWMQNKSDVKSNAYIWKLIYNKDIV